MSKYAELKKRAEDSLGYGDIEADPAILLELIADALRYQWLCDGNGYFMEEEMLCGHGNDKLQADAAIDYALANGCRP